MLEHSFKGKFMTVRGQNTVSFQDSKRVQHLAPWWQLLIGNHTFLEERS
ncbi:hypothetical protein O987_20105 [Comamonas testosteroni TK102]|uniref:Uncharacterized protein n=1 Tax=Comamonas testosteroni TK102 TaxID=1392005 RepID=A0A076PWD3_COMTE|nr:hypothetical protein O987_20105 [Comamonas testosteroni TK102]